MNHLLELKKLGQSVWYDNLRKGLVTSGELNRMVDEYAVAGVTSNPSIFERAVAGTAEYDEDIKRLFKEGFHEEKVLEKLIARDISLAADVLAPVYRATGGNDGFVSVEVNPGLAHDPWASIKEAKHLFSEIGKPNVMIKIPGTKEGLKAIEELTYEGLNVNVTLLFSVERYEEAAWAYLRGLERRSAEGRPVDGISSVAGFFVSRVDTLFDRMIEERAERSKSNDEKARLKNLLGRVAVANAKLAYIRHTEIFSSERFLSLKGSGAKQQRLLWASTGTKNPRYHDTKYVEELIKDGTVSTMPLNTLLAFYDHGKARITLTDGLEGAKKVISELAVLDIDYREATERLEAEGVKSFSDAHAAALKSIAGKKEMLAVKKAVSFRFVLNGFEGAVTEAVEEIGNENFLERLWAKDPTIWKTGLAEKKLIRDMLGWVTLPGMMEDHIEELDSFAREVREAGFKDIVLLGMGGSSLAPLVFSQIFGSSPGYPRLTVLDSTDPDAVKAAEASIDLEKTLFIISSKSGSTIEPLSLFEYFRCKLAALKGDGFGRNFAAITDPGTALEGFSKKFGFRKLFINPKDVGGRFSALSYFGLVPAALIGVDIRRLLEFSSRMEAAVHPCMQSAENPVMTLGAALGALGRLGRDKITFFMPEAISAFGMWIEQLIAESTGKEGKGLVPVVNEPPGKPEDYGNDRVFVSISMGAEGKKLGTLINGLADMGHPVISFNLTDIYEIGGEFFRWEVATSVAGQILGINPFDQPDVELAKKLAIARLNEALPAARLKPPGVELDGRKYKAFLGKSTFKQMRLKDHDLKKAMKEFMGLVKRGDYVGLLAYYSPADKAVEAVFTDLRKALRDSTRAATQFGWGPRYLHSTGQLHKGGPNNGVFFIFCHEDDGDIGIPGSDFTLSQLELSQAFGDMEALDSKGCRVFLLSLKDSSSRAIEELGELIKSSVS